jgi:two-component system nitrogen regulation response regulator NtrX
VVPLRLPPLRDRASDIPALVEHFTQRHRRRSTGKTPAWTDEAIALLKRYRWPGNIRELANIVERLAILHVGESLHASHVLAVLNMSDDRVRPGVGGADEPVADGLPLSESLDAHERHLISSALAAADGNVAEAARRLRTDRPNLYRRMRRLGLLEGG